MNLGLRYYRFNAVGAGGALLQLAILCLLVDGLGCHYLLATLLSVESALIHNFLWHERWTWWDRPRGEESERWQRFIRFHLGNGMVSIFGNLLVMKGLAGALAVPVAVANLTAIAVCSLANLLIGDRWVFRPSRNE